MTAVELLRTSEAGVTRQSSRATVAQMEHRRAELLNLARDAAPASVRHVFYRAVVAGLVPKSTAGYQKVQRQLLELRRAGRLPWHWIVDNGRRAHWPHVEFSAESSLRRLARTYRRNPWPVDGPRVEVWVESESIAGMLAPLIEEFAVPIFPCKGQSSETFARDAAQEYEPGQEVVVLYAGDYDPAGLQIASQLEGKLRTYAETSVSVDFRRLAITDEQAIAMQALGTPAKQASWQDHSGIRHEFVGNAVEAEAVDPRTMRSLFAAEIQGIAFSHAGIDVFAQGRQLEQVEREELAQIARRWSR